MTEPHNSPLLAHIHLYLVGEWFIRMIPPYCRRRIIDRLHTRISGISYPLILLTHTDKLPIVFFHSAEYIGDII